MVSDVSNHPVHILNEGGTLMPSAFIPYCSFETSLSILGEFVPNMTFPVCKMFKPIVYEGHICYTLQISKVIRKKSDFYQGKEGGLMLIIDTNTSSENVSTFHMA